MGGRIEGNAALNEFYFPDQKEVYTRALRIFGDVIP